MLKNKLLILLVSSTFLFGLKKSSSEAKSKKAIVKIESIRNYHKEAIDIFDKKLPKPEFEEEVASVASKKFDDDYALCVYHEKIKSDCRSIKNIYPSKKREGYKEAMKLKDKLLSVKFKIERTSRFKYESKGYKYLQRYFGHIVIYSLLSTLLSYVTISICSIF